MAVAVWPGWYLLTFVESHVPATVLRALHLHTNSANPNTFRREALLPLSLRDKESEAAQGR